LFRFWCHQRLDSIFHALSLAGWVGHRLSYPSKRPFFFSSHLSAGMALGLNNPGALG
jgi:hypothetical protein